jgi:uncharacterized protein involved in response to NO
MRHFGLSQPAARRPVPRGIDRSGPAILSYGFRPFFLLAGLVAVIDMVLWIGALSGLWSVGGEAGPIAWHAHEMLFGYGAAALCGFVLTAVPNWTGRLPVSGLPLLGLVTLWLGGRALMLTPWWLGEVASAAADALFLPILAYVVAREVVIGRNWQNLRVAAIIGVLAALNIAFHVVTLMGRDEGMVIRLAVVMFIVLITQIGGRIVPSFTRNYLARAGVARFPRPAGILDQVTLAATVVAGLCWAVFPAGWPTAVLAGLAAGAHLIRLAGWRGWATAREPLLAVLHIGYGFVPLGFGAIAAASLGLLSQPSALHVWTAGAIGMMTYAMMTRATRGHTGRPLAASGLTQAGYVCLFAVAVLRPLAELAPAYHHVILEVSAVAWIAAFGLFVVEHAPMLLAPSLGRRVGTPVAVEPIRPTS